ncbi:hypothetical protein, partial [Mycobacterium tuberculosis]|uniref:hypothetical protein n=1 Tax=Mycobacterium tuberculosis TaxID=1773 RepID=UPI00254A300F
KREQSGGHLSRGSSLDPLVSDENNETGTPIMGDTADSSEMGDQHDNSVEENAEVGSLSESNVDNEESTEKDEENTVDENE